MMSSLNPCEQYDCNEITKADLHTRAELYSISSYEEVTDANDEGSGSYSCLDLETSFGSLSSYEEVPDADDDFACGTSGVSSCTKVQSNSDNVYQKKRAFSKVTLTRDRKRLKPIDGVVECLLLDSELVSEEVLPPWFGDNNNVVII
jgi:hypothetical protein